jgi:hypothetical protein
MLPPQNHPPNTGQDRLHGSKLLFARHESNSVKLCQPAGAGLAGLPRAAYLGGSLNGVPDDADRRGAERPARRCRQPDNPMNLTRVMPAEGFERQAFSRPAFLKAAAP